MNKTLKLYFLFCILFIFALNAFATENNQSEILLLHSYHQGLEWTDDITSGIQSVLDTLDTKYTLHIEYMDSKRFPPEMIYPSLEETYQKKYHTVPLDVIIVSDNNALQFILNRREDLFPEVPIVFCGINSFTDSMIAGHKQITGVVEEIDIEGTIELILTLFPNTKHIAVINDRTPTGNANYKKYRTAAKKFKNDVTFIELIDVSTETLKQRLDHLNDDTVLLVFTFHKDNMGNHYSIKEFLTIIDTNSDLPAFSFWKHYLGDGILGGIMINGRLQGRYAAQIVTQIIRGKSIDKLPVLRSSPRVSLIDYNEMKKFGIEKSRVSENTVIVNNPHSFYSKHKTLIWSILIPFFILTILVIVLFFNILQRKQAEKALQESEKEIYFQAELMRKTPVITAFHDTQFNLVWANKAYEEATGLSLDEMKGKPCYQAWNLNKPCDNCPVVTVLETGSPDKKELSPDNQSHWPQTQGSWLINAVPLHDESGKVIGAIETSVDITEQKEIKEKLKDHIHEMELITDVFVTVSRMNDIDEICQFIGEKIRLLNENSYVVVSLYDPELDAVRIRAIAGFQRYIDRLLDILGQDITSYTFHPNKMEKYSSLYTTGKVEHVSDGIYGLLEQKVPKSICTTIEKMLNIGDVHTIGFALDENPYGGVIILTQTDQSIKHKTAIETITNHLSVLIQRMQAEDELRKREEQLRNTIMNSPHPMMIHAEDGQVILINESWTEITGYTLEEIPTISQWTKKAYGEKNELVKKDIDRLYKLNKKIYEGEYQITTQSGHHRIWEFSSAPLGSDNNNRQLVLSMATDITERIEIEEERKNLLFNLTERMKEITCLFNILNVGSDETLSIDQILDQINQYIPPGWQHPQFTCSRIVFNDKEFTTENYRKTNQTIISDIIIDRESYGFIQVGLLNNKLDGFLDEERELLSAISDRIAEIIKKKQAEQALIEQRDKFFVIFNNFPEILYIVDPSTYDILFVNQTFKDMLDRDPVGGKCYEQFQGFEEPCSFCTNKIILENKEPYTWEYYNPKLDKYLLITDQIIKWPDGRDVRFEVAVDITKRKQLEKRLKKTIKQLKQSNKELEHFAYVASHDLQEPLRKIKSFTQLLSQKYKDKIDEKTDKYIYYIVDGAERMQNLINDILSFSRVTTHGKEFTNMDSEKALNKAMNNLSVLIDEEQAQISHDSLPTIYGDDSQITQVFQNLIHNAIKFRKTDKNPIIHIAVTEEANKWRFSIQDNGIGMDPQFADKIFVIFQRLHSRNDYKGTGIGLAICKKIINRHDGKIWVDSEPDNGSTFIFTIPKR